MPFMSLALRRFFCGAFALLMFHASVAQAGLIGPEAAVSGQPPAGQAEMEREKVRNFLESATLKDKLKALGVEGLQVDSRVDALTEEEVRTLAQRIDALPAGGALSDREIILILLVALLIIVL
jgi:hypothetical protein